MNQFFTLKSSNSILLSDSIFDMDDTSIGVPPSPQFIDEMPVATQLETDGKSNCLKAQDVHSKLSMIFPMSGCQGSTGSYLRKASDQPSTYFVSSQAGHFSPPSALIKKAKKSDIVGDSHTTKIFEKSKEKRDTEKSIDSLDTSKISATVPRRRSRRKKNLLSVSEHDPLSKSRRRKKMLLIGNDKLPVVLTSQELPKSRSTSFHKETVSEQPVRRQFLRKKDVMSQSEHVPSYSKQVRRRSREGIMRHSLEEKQTVEVLSSYSDFGEDSDTPKNSHLHFSWDLSQLIEMEDLLEDEGKKEEMKKDILKKAFKSIRKVVIGSASSADSDSQATSNNLVPSEDIVFDDSYQNDFVVQGSANMLERNDSKYKMSHSSPDLLELSDKTDVSSKSRPSRAHRNTYKRNETMSEKPCVLSAGRRCRSSGSKPKSLPNLQTTKVSAISTSVPRRRSSTRVSNGSPKKKRSSWCDLHQKLSDSQNDFPSPRKLGLNSRRPSLRKGDMDSSLHMLASSQPFGVQSRRHSRRNPQNRNKSSDPSPKTSNRLLVTKSKDDPTKVRRERLSRRASQVDKNAVGEKNAKFKKSMRELESTTETMNAANLMNSYVQSPLFRVSKKDSLNNTAIAVVKW